MGGRTWMKIATISEGGNTYNIYADSGATPSGTPENTGDLAITESGLFRWNGSAWQNVNSGGSGPSGIITVATSGGDFTSIQAGMNAASAGQTVLVYPGTYNENIDFTAIASSVRVTGFPNAQNVVIAGTGTGSRVTLSQAGTLREVTVVGPSSGSNPAIDCSGLGAGNLAVLFNVAVQGGGAGHTGPLIRGAGSGIVAAIQGLYHNGGDTSGNFFECTGGVCIGLDWIGNVGSCDAFIYISGGSLRVQNVQFQEDGLYSCTDAIESAGGKLQAQSIIIPEQNTPCTNAFHISADGVIVDISDAHLHSDTWDLLVDPALVGTGSTINLTSVDLQNAKSSIPSAWAPDLYIVSHLDTGGAGDNPGNKFKGNVDIGSIQFPAASSTGTGDSTTLGMVAYTFDSSLGTYVEVTSAVQQAGGATATWAIDDGDGLLIGFPTKPTMMDLENVVALIGSTKVNVWTGAAWSLITTMSGKSGESQTTYAETVFERTNGDENLRLGTDKAPWTTWVVNDPPTTGTNRFWVFIENDGALTQAPTVDRVKVGDSYIEEKNTGTARFGGSEEVRTFWEGTGESLSSPSGGANAPNNADITISTNVSYRQARSSYSAGQDNRAGTQLELPRGVDTSRDPALILEWTTDGTSVNPVQWDLYLTQIKTGNVLNVSTVELPVVTQSVAPGGTAQAVYQTVFTIPSAFAALVPGDEFGFMLWRRGTVDTNPDAAIALSLAWEATFID